MGTDCKSAAFSFGGSNPPAPTKNSGIQWVPEFLFYLPCKRGHKGGFEQQRSRPPPAAEAGRRGWGSAPLFQSPAKGLRKKRQAQLVSPAEQSGGEKSPCRAFLDARLAQCTRAHQKNRNVSKYAAVLFYDAMLCLAVFASPARQSSCARMLFCTISPAGVRARVRPSKVAYPARTQFCTKVSCTVENCLPYRVL